MSRISLGFLLLIWSASSSPDNTKEIALFRNNCSGCPIAPDISELPKSRWATEILAEMGRRMGIQDTTFDPLKGLSYSEMEAVIKSGVFPDSAFINP